MLQGHVPSDAEIRLDSAIERLCNGAVSVPVKVLSGNPEVGAMVRPRRFDAGADSIDSRKRNLQDRAATLSDLSGKVAEGIGIERSRVPPASKAALYARPNPTPRSQRGVALSSQKRLQEHIHRVPVLDGASLSDASTSSTPNSPDQQPSDLAFSLAASPARKLEYSIANLALEGAQGPLSRRGGSRQVVSAREGSNGVATVRSHQQTVFVKGGGFFVSTGFVSKDQTLIANSSVLAGRPQTTTFSGREHQTAPHNRVGGGFGTHDLLFAPASDFSLARPSTAGASSDLNMSPKTVSPRTPGASSSPAGSRPFTAPQRVGGALVRNFMEASRDTSLQQRAPAAVEWGWNGRRMKGGKLKARPRVPAPEKGEKAWRVAGLCGGKINPGLTSPLMGWSATSSPAGRLGSPVGRIRYPSSVAASRSPAERDEPCSPDGREVRQVAGAEGERRMEAEEGVRGKSALEVRVPGSEEAGESGAVGWGEGEAREERTFVCAACLAKANHHHDDDDGCHAAASPAATAATHQRESD